VGGSDGGNIATFPLFARSFFTIVRTKFHFAYGVLATLDAEKKNMYGNGYKKFQRATRQAPAIFTAAVSVLPAKKRLV